MLDIGVVLRDFLILILYITENVFIISWFCYRYYKKRKSEVLEKITEIMGSVQESCRETGDGSE